MYHNNNQAFPGRVVRPNAASAAAAYGQHRRETQTPASSLNAGDTMRVPKRLRTNSSAMRGEPEIRQQQQKQQQQRGSDASSVAAPVAAPAGASYAGVDDEVFSGAGRSSSTTTQSIAQVSESIKTYFPNIFIISHS